jgi:hypothetical protein
MGRPVLASAAGTRRPLPKHRFVVWSILAERSTE